MEEPSPVFYCRKKNPVSRGVAYIVHVLKARRGRVQTPRQRFLAHIETLLIDKTLFGFLFLNKHRVGPSLWRSAQPHPWQIKGLAREGFRAIVNLRGARDCATYFLEKEACARAGVTLIDFTLESKRPPTREKIEALARLFETLPAPALIHCKSGVDRTGLVAALYLILREKAAPEEAKKQLSLRYGHLRWSRAGVLDAFLESYVAAVRQSGVSLLDWARSPAYEPETLVVARPWAWARALESLWGRE